MKLEYGLMFVLILFLFLPSMVTYSQVGIGTAVPNKSTMLDIVSDNKGVLVPRVALTGIMDATTIAEGNVESMLVYNTATVSGVKPGYYFWANNKWNKIAITDDNALMSVDNGLTASNGNTRLGGDLNAPTVIRASNINTLAINGLGDGDVTADAIMLIDKTTGVLKKAVASALIRERQKIIIADDGQTQFTPPLPIIDPEKINVYRNGIRIDFTMVDTGVIKLEAGVVCYQNDEIRIVQFN